MRKILVVAAVILLVSLACGAWLFIIKFGGWAHNLGEVSEQIVEDDTLLFVGTWESMGNQEIYSFLSNGSYYIDGFFVGDWSISDGQLTLQNFLEVVYSYSFSQGDTMLTLNDSTHQTILLVKQ